MKQRPWGFVIVILAVMSMASTSVEAAIGAAVLPTSRSVSTNATASAFASIVNGGDETALACQIAPATEVDADFTYQTTDPATNALTGAPNAPVDIPAGGTQSFAMFFAPNAVIEPTEVELTFDCANTTPAPVVSGLNTLLLAAAASPVADIIALVAAAGGIVDIPGIDGTGVFAVATVNAGAADTITAAASAPAGLGVTVFVCQTVPESGVCMSELSTSVTGPIGAGETPTFGFFVVGSGDVPFDPGANRVLATFSDSSGKIRGSTGVAIRTTVSVAPATVSADSGTGDGSNIIRWSAVPGAVSYKVYWEEGTAATTQSSNVIDVSGSASSVRHEGLVDDTVYSYVVTSVIAGEESTASTIVTSTPRRPELTGAVVLPQLDTTWTNDLPGGGIESVCLFDVAFSQIGDCQIEVETDPASGALQTVLTGEREFAFTVERARAYILLVNLGGGFSFAAMTRIVQGDTEQSISKDSEVAMNLIAITELAANDLPTNDYGALGDDHDRILDMADTAVARLNDYYVDPNSDHQADRFVDAVRSFTVDRLNQGRSVFTSELAQPWITRAYGAGIGYQPDLDAIVEEPSVPLNHYFTFVRKIGEEYSIGMSDLSSERWDFLKFGTTGHIATGDTKMVFRLNGGLYVEDYASQTTTGPLQPTSLDAITPVVSPNGSRIAFAARPVGDATAPYNLYTMSASGGEVTQLTDDTAPDVDNEVPLCVLHGNFTPAWSPDGRWLAYVRCIHTEDTISTQVIRLQPDALAPGDPIAYAPDEFEVLLDNGSNILFYYSPAWSPDGGRLNFGGFDFNDGNSGLVELFQLDFRADPSNPTLGIYGSIGAGRLESSFSANGRFLIYSTWLANTQTVSVMNAYTFEVIHDFGDFASAESYFAPRFTAVDLALVAQDGVATDDDGTAVVDDDDPRTAIDGCGNNCNSTGTSGDLYRVIIPAANQSGINFNLPSWF